MKKFFAFLSVVAFAAIATAGTVTWQAYDIAKDGNLINGGVAYLFEGTSTAGVADSIQDGTFDPSSAIATTTTDDEGCLKVTKIGSYVSETVNLYMVVFDTATITDDSNFIVSPVVSQEFGASGNKTFNYTSSLSSPTWSPVTPTPTPPTPPIPEPTTVALLALGLAALGLKRKVA